MAYNPHAHRSSGTQPNRHRHTTYKQYGVFTKRARRSSVWVACALIVALGRCICCYPGLFVGLRAVRRSLLSHFVLQLRVSGPSMMIDAVGGVHRAFAKKNILSGGGADHSNCSGAWCSWAIWRGTCKPSSINLIIVRSLPFSFFPLPYFSQWMANVADVLLAPFIGTNERTTQTTACSNHLLHKKQFSCPDRSQHK